MWVGSHTSMQCASGAKSIVPAASERKMVTGISYSYSIDVVISDVSPLQLPSTTNSRHLHASPAHYPESHRTDTGFCQNIVYQGCVHIRWTEMHPITSTYLQYQGHRQLELIDDQPPAFPHDAFGDPVPICDLGVGATFFAVGLRPRRKWRAGKPDFTGEAGSGVLVNDVQAMGEMLEILVSWHPIGGWPCSLFRESAWAQQNFARKHT